MFARTAALFLLFAASVARADTVDATATTLLTGRQDPRDGTVHTVVPLYQSLTLSATPKRKRSSPFRYTLKGNVRLPAGANTATVCSGDVKLTQTTFTYHADVQNISAGMIPRIYNHSYTIRADLVIPEGGAEGVLVAHADDLGGFSLFAQDGKSK